MNKETYPILPLRDIVVYPKMIVPLFVGREKSIKALQQAIDNDQNIVLATQKEAAVEDPKPEDIFKVGTLGTVVQLVRLPDGTVKVLVEGLERGENRRILSWLTALCRWMLKFWRKTMFTTLNRGVVAGGAFPV